MKENKTLWFEGAGCVPRGDVENCRIRTAFTNDKGERFYLELSGYEKSMHHIKRKMFEGLTYVGHIDYCYQLTDDGEKIRMDIENTGHFEYSKEEILKFVNKKLDCSFEDMKATDSFYGYRVHKQGGYNFMEEHKFDDEKADRAREAFKKIDMESRAKFKSKWAVLSFMAVNEDSITVKYFASDEAMKKAGMNPKERIFEVKF